MAFTRVQIISRALNLLGKAGVMNLSNQSSIVSEADQCFDILAQNAFSVSNWRFATKIAALDQILPVPVGGYWSHAYQLPSDYLKLIKLVPISYDFEIYENSKLYTSYDNTASPLYLEYQFMPLVTNWPAYFDLYFSHELASYLALSNAQSVQYAQYLDQKRTINLAIAQAADSQNRPQTPIQSQPMITNRFISAMNNA